MQTFLDLILNMYGKFVLYFVSFVIDLSSALTGNSWGPCDLNVQKKIFRSAKLTEGMFAHPLFADLEDSAENASYWGKM
jgi:hypothetical protein